MLELDEPYTSSVFETLEEESLELQETYNGRFNKMSKPLL